jgi:hypothetical protein
LNEKNTQSRFVNDPLLENHFEFLLLAQHLLLLDFFSFVGFAPFKDLICFFAVVFPFVRRIEL